MPITKKKKGEILEVVDSKFSQCKALLFTSFSKVSVEDLRDLRKKLKEKGIEYQVVKKSILSIALKNAKFSSIDFNKTLISVGVAFSKTDQFSPARIAGVFAKAKGKECFQIIGGIFDSQFVDAEKIGDIASLVSQDDLYARVLRQFNVPMAKFVYSIKAIADKKAGNN